MTNRRMIRYGLLSIVIFFPGFITYSVLVNPRRYTIDEIILLGGIFAFGIGFSVFAILKGIQQMNGGMYESGNDVQSGKIVANSCNRKRKIIQWLYITARWTGIITWIYLTFFSIYPHAQENSRLQIFVLFLLTMILFCIAAILQYRLKQKERFCNGVNRENFPVGNKTDRARQELRTVYLYAATKISAGLLAGCIIFYFSDSVLIRIMPVHISVVGGITIILYLLARNSS